MLELLNIYLFKMKFVHKLFLLSAVISV